MLDGVLSGVSLSETVREVDGTFSSVRLADKLLRRDNTWRSVATGPAEFRFFCQHIHFSLIFCFLFARSPLIDNCGVVPRLSEEKKNKIQIAGFYAPKFYTCAISIAPFTVVGKATE